LGRRKTRKKAVSNEIKNTDELDEIKMLLQTKVGIPFCTNVLRIALNI
jgi:hypothetical protein